MKFPNRYLPPAKVSIDFSDTVSMTQQHFKDECDVNTIVKRFQQTGVLPNVDGALYGDFTSFPDNPLDAQKMLVEASDNFLKLPSGFRKELHNNPAEFLDFIANPANKDRCIELGIFNKPVQQFSDQAVVPSQKTVVSEDK